MILIIITYLAGLLTILSPCILPVLPFVFSRSGQPFLKSGLPLLLGMSITFSFFSVLAVLGGEWVSQANDWGRIISVILFGIFGVSLIFPSLSEKIFLPLTRWGLTISTGSQKQSFKGSLLIGVGTGLLWAPCAGPILGLVLTGAASQNDVSKSAVLLISYSLGAATSLGLALVAGSKFLGFLKKFLGWDAAVKKVLGVAVLLGVFIIAFKLDRVFLTKLSKFETTSIETQLLSFVENKKDDAPKNSMMMMSAKNQVHTEGTLPDLSGAVAWINSKPLTNEDLLGKVVLIDFWTYSCINCLRTLPYVKAWQEKYGPEDFVVIGVHTPEFGFEKDLSNVQNAVKELGITYPVAIDNNYKIWNSFQNQYWPAHYFIDRQGRIRNHHFGEGNYDESEKIIRELLTENGETLSDDKATVVASGVQVASHADDVLSPETYVGYSRAENLILNPNLEKNKSTSYNVVADLKLNQWSLDGQWVISEERATLGKSHGKIRYRFHARDLHLVLGAQHKVHFKVTVDGQAPGASHGVDIDENGLGEVKEHKLYQLIRQKADSPIKDHLFEIEFFDNEVDAYAFTFG